METHAQDAADALSLVERLLHPDSVKRYTPRDALEHPFLRDPLLASKGQSEADIVPHPFGRGVCGELHHLDEHGHGYVFVWDPKRRERKRKRHSSDGGRDCVGKAGKVQRKEGDKEVKAEYQEVSLIDLGSDDEEERLKGMVARPVLAGEGIAIGSKPCEFHRAELGYWFG